MIIVRAALPDEYGWLCERTGIAPTADMRVIQSCTVDGRILAQIAAEGWTPNAVRLHVAIDSPIALRSLLREAARWIFVQAGRGVAIGVIKADNSRSLRLAKRIGFREVYRLADGWAKDVDLVTLELRREWCRWHYEPERKVA